MPKLPRLTAKELVQWVEKKGFMLVRQSGSHKIYRNESGLRITIPFHSGKIVHPKIIKQIMTDLNLKGDDFHGSF